MATVDSLMKNVTSCMLMLRRRNQFANFSKKQVIARSKKAVSSDTFLKMDLVDKDHTTNSSNSKPSHASTLTEDFVIKGQSADLFKCMVLSSFKN